MVIGERMKMKWMVLIIGLVLLLMVSSGCIEGGQPTSEEIPAPELDYIEPGTTLEEKKASYYPDAHIYPMTSNIKTYQPLGSNTYGYLRDGQAYLRNEGASGLIKVTIVPVDRHSKEMSLPEKEECLNNEETIFVEANKSVLIRIVRYRFKGGIPSSNPRPCAREAIFTEYESYNETKTVESKRGTFHFQGKLNVKLAGEQYNDFAKAVGIYTYPSFIKSKHTVNGEMVGYLYFVNDRWKYVKVW